MKLDRSIAKMRVLAALLAGGSLFQLGACFNYFRDFNYCGSVLACDPVEFRFLTSGYQGPGVDLEVDPACTFPPFCANDPFVGGLAAGG